MSPPSFVAMSTSSRRPRFFSHCPMMVSDSPPLLPGFQLEYTSAVSIRLKPPPVNASSTSKEVGASIVQPNTLPPRVKGAIDSEDCPSCLFCIAFIFDPYGQPQIS